MLYSKFLFQKDERGRGEREREGGREGRRRNLPRPHVLPLPYPLVHPGLALMT